MPGETAPDEFSAVTAGQFPGEAPVDRARVLRDEPSMSPKALATEQAEIYTKYLEEDGPEIAEQYLRFVAGGWFEYDGVKELPPTLRERVRNAKTNHGRSSHHGA